MVRKSNFSPLAPGTKPLPEHLARKPEQRKELESLIPVAGNAFGDGRSPYQWAEFQMAEDQAPRLAVRVNLDQPEQVWHYLGETSTDSRAQYSHNPSRRVHNPRANFLDSVKSSLGTVANNRRPAPSSSATPYRYPHHLPHHAPHPHPQFLPATATTAPAPAYRHSLLQRPPLFPPPTPPAAAVPPPAPAMPSAYRSLQTPSVRHAPYPQLAKPQQGQQQQQSYIPPNNFANVRELIARRRLAQITDHANIFAGYNIVSPELVVETLLGPMGSVPPQNGLEKLELAMAQQRVQPRATDGSLLTLQPLNMRSEEVTRLLQMLRFSLVSHRERLDVIQRKESESVKPVDKSNVAAAKLAGKYAYLDQQRAQAPTVYRSPYDLSGFSQYAKETYELSPGETELPQPSLANDYFASLSQENQEKILKTCGSFVQKAIERSTSHSRHSSASNLLSTALAQRSENPTIDITTVGDNPLSRLDRPLHADSPASNFSRSHLRFQSPNDFTSHGPESHHDHHDLFGDQQANTRFWQHGPWAAGDGNTPNDENRPFFGPHERLKQDYASSEISVGRGPGSLHSADMVGFGADDLNAEPSP